MEVIVVMIKRNMEQGRREMEEIVMVLERNIK